MELQTCSLCGKTVQPEDGRYGATGDHWDCTQPARDVIADVMRGSMREPIGAALGCYVAKGGYKVHLKRSGLNTALCGHTPMNTAVKMRQRGGWWICRFGPDDAVPAPLRGCERCYVAAGKSLENSHE